MSPCELVAVASGMTRGLLLYVHVTSKTLDYSEDQSKDIVSVECGTCRLAASALESSDWTVAALDALEVVLGNLSRGFKSAGPWRHGLGGRCAPQHLPCTFIIIPSVSFLASVHLFC